jgi:DNA invertase Pin-like site-specific DNA recombinase/soluble cytochrome b562
LQNPKSCEDQERDVRAGLAKSGIDATNAVAIPDAAESGTRADRPGFKKLLEILRHEKDVLLAVDDQSRFGRDDNVYGLIKDLVFRGGRFISTGEGIDTTQRGWELRVKVMELHNSTTIGELGHRVRRGQRGRIERKLTAGDYPFGYESFYVHPEQAATYRGVGPKPEKDVRIYEVEANWVRDVFTWFLAGWSIQKIATELTRLKVDKGHRARKPIWHTSQVRRMLDNEKYVGEWSWGETTTIRDSSGKTKQIPVPEAEQVFVERPELRIVDQQTWEKAKKRLQQLDDMYGPKEGQKSRGPRVHHTEAYPGSLMGGLVFCGEEKCGSRLWEHASGKRKYLACPNRGDAEDMCPMRTQVPTEKAEQAILGCLSAILGSWPSWIEKAVAAMRRVLDDVANRVPEEVAAKEKQLLELQSEIKNLVRQLAKHESEARENYLAEAEASAKALQAEIREFKDLLDSKAEMPDDAWVAEQLRDMSALIRDELRPAAILLRKLLGKVWAHQVILPGKQRGYAQIRFRINGWEALRAVLPAGALHRVVEMLANGHEVEAGISDEFCIDLGGPSEMDKWAPMIAEMRERKVPWKEIWKITGLGSGPAYVAWKRFVDAQKAQPDETVNQPQEPDQGPLAEGEGEAA